MEFQTLLVEPRGLSDSELWNQTKQAAQKEKHATLELLENLAEVESRRLFAKRAYSSLFEFVVQELHYSESQASERINAMRLMRKTPEVKEKIQSGSLSLTTASQLQRFLKTEKKKAAQEYSSGEKLALISECEHLSKRRVEKILLCKSSLPAPKVKEGLREVTPELTEFKCALKESGMKTLSEIQNLKGCDSDHSLSQILEEALWVYLEHLQKKTYGQKKAYGEKAFEKKIDEQKASCPSVSITLPATCDLPPGTQRYIRKQVRAATLLRSQGQCEFVDSLSKKRCESRHRLQFEHRMAHALGGSREADNIAHFCASHNQLRAIETFGYEKMAGFVLDLTSEVAG
jgi:hypothetical protein